MSPFFIPYQINTTPLHVASQNGLNDVVQTLLGAGADVNTADSDVSDDICGVTAYMYMYWMKNISK